MTYATVSGYPFDGYDGSDESFSELVDSCPPWCPDKAAHQAEDDAVAAEQSAAERTIAGGRCTLCENDSPELLPWSGERLCWSCVDLNLDLLAKAIEEDLPVQVGSGYVMNAQGMPVLFTMEAAR